MFGIFINITTKLCYVIQSDVIIEALMPVHLLGDAESVMIMRRTNGSREGISRLRWQRCVSSHRDYSRRNCQSMTAAVINSNLFYLKTKTFVTACCQRKSRSVHINRGDVCTAATPAGHFKCLLSVCLLQFVFLSSLLLINLTLT